jgi:hypothetical protein
MFGEQGNSETEFAEYSSPVRLN